MVPDQVKLTTLNPETSLKQQRWWCWRVRISRTRKKMSTYKKLEQMTVQTDWSNSIMRKVLLFSLKLKGNERSICRTVGNVSERHNLWNNLFTSEFDPFGLVTFAKSSKAAWLCKCVSDVEDLGDSIPTLWLHALLSCCHRNECASDSV